MNPSILRYFCPILSVYFLVCCLCPASVKIIPWPQDVAVHPGEVRLTHASPIVTSRPELQPLATVLRDEIFRATGLRLTTADPADPGPHPGHHLLLRPPDLQ